MEFMYAATFFPGGKRWKSGWNNVKNDWTL